MLKEIAGYLGKYKKDVCMSPFAMVGEVVCEMLIPVLMGKLVDNGIYAGNTSYVRPLIPPKPQACSDLPCRGPAPRGIHVPDDVERLEVLPEGLCQV